MMLQKAVSRRVGLSVEQMESRLVPAAADFVQGLYTDVLHRSGSQAEVKNWVNAIKAGLGGGQVTHGFMQSDERHGIEVDESYGNLLGRSAEPAGRAAWVQAMHNGLNRDAMERAILNSPEYQSHHADDKSFVEALYDDVLGRAASSGESQAMQNVLASGSRRRDDLIGIFQNSDERLGKHTHDNYTNYLGRSESEAKRSAWINAIRRGSHTLEMEREAFLGSREYELRHGFDDPVGHT